MSKSRDGWQWTRHGGVDPGLPCIGVIRPSQNVKDSDHVFDVVIIGAGYTGLTAARDLTVAGLLFIRTHLEYDYPSLMLICSKVSKPCCSKAETESEVEHGHPKLTDTNL